MYQLVGTDGYASKYPVEEYCLRPEQVDTNVVANHENLNAHGSLPEDVKRELMNKYKHPIHQELEETAKKVGGHGGMDISWIIVWCIVCATDYRWIWMCMISPSGVAWLS